MTEESDSSQADKDKRALIATAQFVDAMFEAELPELLLHEPYLDVHDKLRALLVELESAGYLERYRDGYQATGH